MESMQAGKLYQPIVLQPKPGTGYWLLAGAHRFEAAKKLKWDSIRATILEGLDADQAALVEIDENLIRADLSPAEIAAHVDARKEIYERLHPQTKRGGNRRSKCQVGTLKAPAFIDQTAQASGRGRRTLAREASRGKTIPNVATLAHTSLDKGEELDALIKLPDAKRDALIAQAKAGEKVSAKTALKQHSRGEREQELADKIVALPTKKYGVILADPEWRFEPWSRETGLGRAADNHYPTSITEVIAERPVESIAAKDCVLFLWATAPMLPQALVVMSAWGFDYKTHAVWMKRTVGTGYWFRNAHELLLVGTRGNVVAPAPGTQWNSVFTEEDDEELRHSEKPEAAIEMIEEYYPNVPKIELNCRGKPRAGWDAWGNEVDDATSIAS
jgi:N6-adenosine-specific RNA methylase IME4